MNPTLVVKLRLIAEIASTFFMWVVIAVAALLAASVVGGVASALLLIVSCVAWFAYGVLGLFESAEMLLRVWDALQRRY